MRSLFAALALAGCPTATPEPPPEPAALDWRAAAPDLCVSHTFWSADDRALGLAVLEAMGVSSLRTHLLWHQIEPSPGAFDFSRQEPVIDDLLARGIEPLALLAYGNPWASSATDADTYYPPDDPADFAAYAAATATHYAGRIRRYEVWNEQNAGYRFWRPEFAGDPVAYGQLFAAAADAIHAADPQAEVLLGGTFFHDQFIPGALEFNAAMPAEAWAAADGLAFHPYTFYPPQVPPEYAGTSSSSASQLEVPLVGMIAGLRRTAADAGRPDLPLSVTEFGWPAWDRVDAREQADWAERSVLLGLAHGVGTWCAYTLLSREGNTAEDRFGMADGEDGSLLPYGQRFADLGARLAGLVQAAPLPLAAGQHGVALRFDDGTEREIGWGVGEAQLNGASVPLGETPTGW